MKKYLMKEWLDIHNDANNRGTTYVTGVNLNKDMTIDHLEVTVEITGSLTSYGGLTAGNVKGIEGKKQFVLEVDGGVSLVVDEDEVVKSFISVPKLDFKNKKVIPFDKWMSDLVYVQNKNHIKDEDQYRKVKVLGCEVNGIGNIRAINAKITKNHDYGPFGPIVTDQKIRADELLMWTYGMHRNDICDDWRGRYRNEYRDCKVYFNEKFDLVFEDDGLYHIYCPERYALVG